MEIAEQELAELKAKAERATELESKAKAADDFKTDMLKYKQERSELAEKLAKIEQSQQEADKARLAEQGQWKGLFEKSELEKAELKKRADGALDSVTHFVRSRDVEAEAVKAGIRPEALPDLRLLGLERLEVKRDGNEIKVLGSADFVAEQKKLRPHWFAEAGAPNFDGKRAESTSGGEKSLTELAKKDPDAYKKALAALMAKKA